MELASGYCFQTMCLAHLLPSVNTPCQRNPSFNQPYGHFFTVQWSRLPEEGVRWKHHCKSVTSADRASSCNTKQPLKILPTKTSRQRTARRHGNESHCEIFILKTARQQAARRLVKQIKYWKNSPTEILTPALPTSSRQTNRTRRYFYLIFIFLFFSSDLFLLFRCVCLFQMDFTLLLSTFCAGALAVVAAVIGL